jgi:pyruvate formate lyase activating enzyme
MGVWLEITNLIVPKWTDNTDEIRKMCKWLAENGFKKVPVHFSRFYPTYKLEQLPPTPVDTLNHAAQIANDEGLLYVYTGNVPGNEISDTKCPGCGNTLIVREGYRIAANTLVNGKCNKCGVAVDGVWN